MYLGFFFFNILRGQEISTESSDRNVSEILLNLAFSLGNSFQWKNRKPHACYFYRFSLNFLCLSKQLHPMILPTLTYGSCLESQNSDTRKNPFFHVKKEDLLNKLI